jgi:hypothetical protein
MKAERVFQKVCLISFYFLIIIMGQLWYFKSKNGHARARHLTTFPSILKFDAD